MDANLLLGVCWEYLALMGLLLSREHGSYPVNAILVLIAVLCPAVRQGMDHLRVGTHGKVPHLQTSDLVTSDVQLSSICRGRAPSTHAQIT